VATSRRHVNERGKTSREFRVCVELMDTTDWLRDAMSRQLESWGLTMWQFRVLQTIYHDGPQYQTALSRRFRCSKQNMSFVMTNLLKHDLVYRETPTRRPVFPSSGARIIHVALTPKGQRLMAKVFPKLEKLVRARIRALNKREQQMLSRLCQKLREGDVREMVMMEVERRDLGF
jgi:MarR family transcriptional regulator, 2-MHQ and catechol-resistance regulon repressor